MKIITDKELRNGVERKAIGRAALALSRRPPEKVVEKSPDRHKPLTEFVELKALLERIAESMRAIADKPIAVAPESTAAVEAMTKTASVLSRLTVPKRPRQWVFAVERDSDGRITEITATAD